MASETITVEFIEEDITLEITGASSWDSISGKPTAAAQSSFMVSDASPFGWIVKTLAQVKTLLGLDAFPVANVVAEAFQAPAFANPLVCDATTHKDFKTGTITGNTTINLTNASDGDAGMIIFLIDGTGGYTVALGAMFTQNIGGGTIDATANKNNVVCWRKVGSDIYYSIGQIV